MPAAVGVVALAIGLGIGSTGGRSTQAEPSRSVDSSRYAQLTATLASVTAERDAMKQKVAAAADDGAALDARETALDTREAELDALRTKLSKKSKHLAARAATLAADTAADAPASSGADAAAAVYYANCDAVRAAGAAPIHTGDAGYSGRLDRDGDGVGCE